MTTQSFSRRVKTELAQYLYKKDKTGATLRAEIASIIITCAAANPSPQDGIDKTEKNYRMPQLSRWPFATGRVEYLAEELGISPDKLPETLGLVPYLTSGDTKLIPRDYLMKAVNVRAFLRGAFICAGSVADPERAHHMELCTRDKRLSDLWKILFRRIKRNVHHTILVNSPIEVRQTVRASADNEPATYVLYMKDANNIQKFLGLIGAGGSFCDFENAILISLLRNQANRAANCDSANTDKSVNSADRQLKAIERLKNTVGLEHLPPRLADAAIKRLENPDLPLGELCELLTPPVSKSGASHRLRQLEKLAAADDPL